MKTEIIIENLNGTKTRVKKENLIKAYAFIKTLQTCNIRNIYVIDRHKIANVTHLLNGMIKKTKV